MAQTATYDVLGVGNAIVDAIATADDAFLAAHAMDKGGMRLIDAGQAERLTALMQDAKQSSGGSCANTMAGIASLGGRGAYIGRVKADALGGVFATDLRAAGVHFDAAPANEGPATARCLIFVTPDAQRTMNTYLGACVELSPADIDEALVKQAKVTYIEGYLWDQPAAKDACRKAMDCARGAGREVSFTLSDSFCVGRWRSEFLDLMRSRVDILFANESELLALYEVDSFDAALQKVRRDVKIAALTRSEKGSVVVRGDETHVVDAAKVAKVVDTTGAGDLYAAGFLYGYTHGKSLYDCGRIGGACAAEVISHVGARPLVPLAGLVKGI
jgi:sugar/nucleoside kinase (ribokinase family)